MASGLRPRRKKVGSGNLAIAWRTRWLSGALRELKLHPRKFVAVHAHNQQAAAVLWHTEIAGFKVAHKKTEASESQCSLYGFKSMAVTGRPQTYHVLKNNEVNAELFIQRSNEMGIYQSKTRPRIAPLPASVSPREALARGPADHAAWRSIRRNFPNHRCQLLAGQRTQVTLPSDLIRIVPVVRVHGGSATVQCEQWKKSGFPKSQVHTART